MARSKRGTYCSGINCNNSKVPGLSFFGFPRDAERTKKWAINMHRKDLLNLSAAHLNKNVYICADHFEDRMFMNPQKRDKLVWSAVPTIVSQAKPKLSRCKTRKDVENTEEMGPDRDAEGRSLAPVSEEQICTACLKPFNIRGINSAHRHPVLGVLICKMCFKWYRSAKIEQNINGVDEQCRWCGDAIHLIGCDFCHNAFCQKCIERNIGGSALKNIRATKSVKWSCYVCIPAPLKELQRHCSTVLLHKELQTFKNIQLDEKKEQSQQSQHQAQQPMTMQQDAVQITNQEQITNQKQRTKQKKKTNEKQKTNQKKITNQKLRTKQNQRTKQKRITDQMPIKQEQELNQMQMTPPDFQITSDILGEVLEQCLKSTKVILNSLEEQLKGLQQAECSNDVVQLCKIKARLCNELKKTIVAQRDGVNDVIHYCHSNLSKYLNHVAPNNSQLEPTLSNSLSMDDPVTDKKNKMIVISPPYGENKPVPAIDARTVKPPILLGKIIKLTNEGEEGKEYSFLRQPGKRKQGCVEESKSSLFIEDEQKDKRAKTQRKAAVIETSNATNGICHINPIGKNGQENKEDDKTNISQDHTGFKDLTIDEYNTVAHIKIEVEEYIDEGRTDDKQQREVEKDSKCNSVGISKIASRKSKRR